MQGTSVRSLVRDLRSHRTWGQKTKKHRSNIVRNSINTLKNGPHQKIFLRNSRIQSANTEQAPSIWTSLVSHMVKKPPAMQETWLQSLGWEDLLEEEMATHPSILAWRILWTEEPGRLQSIVSHRVGHDWATHTFTFHVSGTDRNSVPHDRSLSSRPSWRRECKKQLVKVSNAS